MFSQTALAFTLAVTFSNCKWKPSNWRQQPPAGCSHQLHWPLLWPSLSPTATGGHPTRTSSSQQGAHQLHWPLLWLSLSPTVIGGYPTGGSSPQQGALINCTGLYSGHHCLQLQLEAIQLEAAAPSRVLSSTALAFTLAITVSNCNWNPSNWRQQPPAGCSHQLHWPLLWLSLSPTATGSHPTGGSSPQQGALINCTGLYSGHHCLQLQLEAIQLEPAAPSRALSSTALAFTLVVTVSNCNWRPSNWSQQPPAGHSHQLHWPLLWPSCLQLQLTQLLRASAYIVS